MIHRDKRTGQRIVHVQLIARLILRAGGEHHITEIAGGIPVRVHSEMEIALLQQLLNALRLTQAGQRVCHMREDNTRLVRLLALKRLQHARIPGRQRVSEIIVRPARELGSQQLAHTGKPTVLFILLRLLKTTNLCMEGRNHPMSLNSNMGAGPTRAAPLPPAHQDCP